MAITVCFRGQRADLSVVPLYLIIRTSSTMPDLVVNRLTSQVLTLESLQDSMMSEGYATQNGEVGELTDHPFWAQNNHGIWSHNGPLDPAPDIFQRTPFILVVRVTAGDLTFTWPDRSGPHYAVVYWGDGTEVEFNKGPPLRHTFSAPGDYAVSITGEYSAPNFGAHPADRLKAIDVRSWGNGVILGDWSYAFEGCSNMTVSATNTPNHETNMSGMFKDCPLANPATAPLWDVGTVGAMDYMLQNAAAFDQDLSGWCVSNIATEPVDFALGSGLDVSKHPVWGSCP